MARFPSIDETGAFEAPEVQSKIKHLVTGGAGDIRVDTSVGTRVFVGDTMIYGDTGWRAISTWDSNGNVTGEPLTTSYQPIPDSSEGGGVYVKRNGNTVYWRIQNLERLGTSPTLLFDSSYRLSTGFRSPNGNKISGPRTTTENMFFLINSNGTISRSSGDEAGTSGPIKNLNDYYDVTTPWPTSLPGSPL